MIEKIIQICDSGRVIDLVANHELAAFLLPEITKHKRDYDIILALGTLAQIEFGLGTVTLRTSPGTENQEEATFYGIKRFTRQKLEGIAESFAEWIDLAIHDKPYRPDIQKTFDYDC